MGVIRRLAVMIAVLIAISTAAACQDHTPRSPFFRSAWPPPTKSIRSAATLPVNLCDLLHWSDLGYPDTGPDSDGPTKTGNQPDWQQYCQWQSYQSNAGFTLPPAPTCDSQNNDSAGGDAECMAEESQYLNIITAHSSWVTVAIGWSPGSDGETTAPYYRASDGRKVYLNDQSANSTCIAVLLWARGILKTEVIDATKAFGTPCDQTKKFVNLLITREPH